MVEGRQDGAGHQAQIARPLRRGAEKDDRAGAVAAVGPEVVFDRLDVGVAEPVRQLADLERVGVIVRGGHLLGADSGKEVEAELHAARTGMCLIPQMKDERKRSTGPASSMLGKRSSSSSNMTRISNRARPAPRQKCSPIPKPRCSLGLRPTSKR